MTTSLYQTAQSPNRLSPWRPDTERRKQQPEVSVIERSHHRAQDHANHTTVVTVGAQKPRRSLDKLSPESCPNQATQSNRKDCVFMTRTNKNSCDGQDGECAPTCIGTVVDHAQPAKAPLSP